MFIVQAKILHMMEDNQQLALRIDGAIQSASQEMTNLRAELTATNRRLAELGSSSATPSIMENNQHNAQGQIYRLVLGIGFSPKNFKRTL
ncbi:ATP-binding cassette sub-family A member 12 [Platysternon megacephalum]|uniref:ATP-binding cassette sub-family A member 12 n=1 Tax=Platysternon megacephalum TaxID=55544 RepID=A0A4D9EZB4_9SAUR|nr:ATP-binding cassette sub-family A member 12 [Platysternon megacephalum]